MIKKISTETISAIKDGAVVTLAANAEIKIIDNNAVLTIDGKDFEWDEDYMKWIDSCVKEINYVIKHHNLPKLYEIINTIFTEMDYNRTFKFGDFTLGLVEKENDTTWLDEVIYVIPTDAKDEDGDWDWSEAAYFSLEPYYKTYADILRGDRNIIDDMTKSIYRVMETATE